MLGALEAGALTRGFCLLRLETGMRQQPAMALYRAHRFVQIPPFGVHANDPTSVCFEKHLVPPIVTHRP